MTIVKEGTRLSRFTAGFDALVHDGRSAVGALRQSPDYTAWVVGSLAIGMAVTIAALAILNASMLLPFAGVSDQDRLLRVLVSRSCGRPDCWIPMSSDAAYSALSDNLTGLQSLAGYATADVAVALPETRTMRALVTSTNYFDVLGVHPAVGRGFTTNDERTYAAVAVIGYGTWMREFGGDPSVVGRSIRVAGEFVQIVGVAPSFFIGIDRIRPGGSSPDIWLPMWLADRVVPVSAAEQRRGERAFAFVGRLKQGRDINEVQAEATVVAQHLAVGYRQSAEATRAEVRRVWRVRPESWRFGIILVLPIPVLVLVIACVNAANLMLARGSQRQREFAIRLAIGARRARIIRQLLLESTLLATMAAALAMAIAAWALGIASNPLGVPIPFDRVVLACTVVTGLATPLAFGLMPAVRTSAQRPSSTLGTGGARNDALPHQSRMRRALIVAQMTLSLGLLATAWQLVGTVRSQAVSSGTPSSQLLIGRFDLDGLQSGTSTVESFYDDVLARVSRLPGVEAIGLARANAVWTFGQEVASASLVVWRPTDAADDGHKTIGGYAGGSLFQAVGLRVLAGRDFREDEHHLSRPQVAVVNRTFANNMGAGAVVGSILRVAPVGRDFNAAIDVRIIGIVEPTIEPRYEDGPPPEKVYLPSPLEPEPALAMYVRTQGMATAIAQPVREVVSRIDSRVPILELGSLQEYNERSFGQQLWLARAAVVVGVVGLLLATAGLYGISSYVVAMRSREIAIRMAIGARPRAILAMVLTQSMWVAAIGLVVGGGASIVASRLIQSEYHGIVGIDRAAFAGAVGLFLGAMLLASVVPAVRASRVDPVENLKDA